MAGFDLTLEVDSGMVGFRGPLSGLPSILHRVHFTYSYCVGGLKHNGRFFLLVNSKNAGEELRQELVGRNVPVKYADRKPGVALLIDQELAGKRVLQGPPLTYRGSMTASARTLRQCEKPELLPRA